MNLLTVDENKLVEHIKAMPDIVIPQKTNLALAVAIVSVFLASLLALPFLSLPYWAMILIVLCLVPLNTPLWSLIHEAIHKNFYSSRKLNELAGRVMSIVFGAAFGVLRFGHLMHHQYNRDWENEYYSGSKFKAYAHHYFQMLGGLYLTEVVMSFLISVLPGTATRKIARKVFSDDSHYQAVLNSLLKTDNVKKIRTDCLWIVLLYACAFMSFGLAWGVVLLGLAGRAVIISIMDNSYHYGTPRDGSLAAKELKTSGSYSKFILNFNYHLTHHNNVALPWSRLKTAHEEKTLPYAQTLVSALLEQFKGPIKIKD